MNLDALFGAIQFSPVGSWMNNVGIAYPFVETVHVIAVALVFGSILIVDLRLLGVASTNMNFTSVARYLLIYTWFGFFAAVITGALLFTTNATGLYLNPAFQWKMALLALAGVNMLVFEFLTVRSITAWDTGAPPLAARTAGLLSVALWAAVIVAGRLIGYAAVSDPFAALPA